jgi:hypothetical protein
MPRELITRRFLLGQLAASGIVLAQSSTSDSRPSRPHPRLILPDSDLPRIHALSREHPLARKLRENLEREADKLQTAPTAEFKLVGPRLLAQSRRVLDRVYTLALLYRLDGQAQHLQRGVKELRAAALFPNWNPAHFLDVAEMTHAFAIGYDWLYPGLAQADRDWIRSALVEKGLDPAITAYKEPAPWVMATHNWNLVCNSGVAIGALALADEEPDRSYAILHNAFDSIPRALATYAPDGGWPEGPGYWNYATRYLVSLLASLETAMDNDQGFSQARGFEKTGRFRVYCNGPLAKTFNFADSTDEDGTAPEMFWLARRFDQPVYAWDEQRQADSATHSDALDLVWFYKDEKPPESGEWPLETIFSGIQAAFMRTSWEDPNALFLGVKGGDNKANHAHLDLGSFVFDAGGVRWAYDPGPDNYDVPGYFGAKRFSDFKTSTESHNTILIDGENQSAKAEARITRHEFAPDFSWVQIDLSKAYPGKVKVLQRRIGLAQKQALLIEDTLVSDQPVDPLWGMMTDAEIAFDGQTAELKKNDWTLSCEIRSPHHAVFDVVTAQNTKKLVVRVGAKVSELDLSVVLIPHKTGQPKPVIVKHFPEA